MNNKLDIKLSPLRIIILIFVCVLLISVPAFKLYSSYSYNKNLPLPDNKVYTQSETNQNNVVPSGLDPSKIEQVANAGPNADKLAANSIPLMESPPEYSIARDFCMLTTIGFSFPYIVSNSYETIKSQNCDQKSFNAMNLASVRAQLETSTHQFQTHASGPYRTTATKDMSGSSEPYTYIGAQKYANFFSIKIGIIDLLKHPEFALGGNLVTKALYYPLRTRQNLSLFWSPGEQIYCLIDPKGKHYLMTWYSAQLFEGLNRSNLISLNKLLVLPPGWRFVQLDLNKPVWLTRNVNDGYAVETVIDNLGNFYTKIELVNGEVTNDQKIKNF